MKNGLLILSFNPHSVIKYKKGGHRVAICGHAACRGIDFHFQVQNKVFDCQNPAEAKSKVVMQKI